ncbi:U3 small nucleolar RNA-associated protein 13 [Tilletia horrida]|nr:U3 small nucleolar RNA-associated protein 13 [Tilletia horrida]
MAASNPNKTALLSSFSLAHSFAPFFTGGPLAFSPDAAAALAFTSYGDDLKLVRTADAHTLLTLHGDTQPITALALSPDGVYLAVASRSLAIRIYNVAQTIASAAAPAGSPGTFVKPTLVRTLARTHDAPITVLEIDPSSSLLASGSSDSTVKVWDLAGGFCTHIFPAHGGVVSALCWFMPGFNPKQSRIQDDGQPAPIHLFTAAVDGRIRLWDLRASAVGGSSAGKRKPAAVLPTGAHVSVVRGLSISGDGLRLVSGARDRTVALWTQSKPATPSAPQWTLKELLSANEGVESVGFLPPVSDSRTGAQDFFFTAGSEGDLRIWNFPQGKATLRASNQDPTSAAAAAVAAAASSNKSANGVDPEDYESTTRAITQVQLLPAAGALAVVHADQNIELLSLGQHVGSGASPHSLHQQRPLLKPIKQLVGFNDEVIDLALLSPGSGIKSEDASTDAEKETHLAVCTNAPSLRVYSLPNRNASTSATPSSSVTLLHGHTDIALCLDRSPDGKWLASAGKDRVARVWMRLYISQQDVATQVDKVWTCVGIAEGHTESVGALAFARKNIAGVGAPFLCSASQDRTTKVWDLAPLQRVLAEIGDSALAPGVARSLFPLKLKSLLTLKIHEKDINTLDVAPNNSFLASGSQDRTAKLFKLEYRASQPSEVKHAATNAIAALSSSSNGKKKSGQVDSNAQVEAETARILAAAAVSVHATATLTHLTTCNGHRRGVWSVRFSPVDPAFVTASSDRTIRMWSLLGAPQGSLTDSTPGAGLVVGGDFGRCVKTFESHSNSVLRVLFFNRGMQLLSAGADGTCRVWNVRTEENLGVLDPRTKLEEILGEEKKEDQDADDAAATGADGDEDEDEDEGAKVWALAVGYQLVSGKKGAGSDKGVGLISGGADSVIRFWEDQTVEIEVAKAKKRQIEVEREQEFSNFLTLRDYRNAIALALQLDQPRRLLNLFTRVHASRPDPSAAGYGKLSGPRSYLLAREGLIVNDSHAAMTSVLQSAGIIDSARSSHKTRKDKKANGEDGDDDAEAAAAAADARSVTGLAAVDDVIRKLPSLQLIQLLLYVRDWNSTVRTSTVAQVVLHAIFRFHTAQRLMTAFEAVAPKLRARAAAKGRASGVRQIGDWGAVLDGLLPYTERHYARADRTLVESRTLEYTLAGMDTVLGPAEWDVEVEDEEVINETGNAVNGKGAAVMRANGQRASANVWADGDEESDGMDVDFEAGSESDASEE